MNDAISSRLSPSSIEKKLASDGSPEMRRHWKQFLKVGISLESLQQEQLQNQIRLHCRPLFGQPLVASLILIAASALIANNVATTVSLSTGTMSLTWIGAGLAFVGSAFLLTYLLTLVQRRLIWRMEPLLAKCLALSLARKNYRNWLQQQSFFVDTLEAIQSAGVRSWDDPSYLRWYRSEEANYRPVPPQSTSEQLRSELLKFLGSKDPLKRKHVPGQFQDHLIKGKKSVSRFVKANQEQLTALREGSLPLEEAWKLIERLQRTEVRQETRGACRLEELLKLKEGNVLLPEQTIQVEVWQRDPWQDLCSQTNFYSSASLRGVQAVGRSTKGRLSPFQYLDNPSISAIDFSDRRGRAVRARLGLCQLLDEKLEAPIPVLFVDGVEGSNRIDPGVILQGLIDYAKEIEVAAVLFYQYPHNSIPKRFVKSIRANNELRGNASVRTVKLSYFHSGCRQYLDAFGWPVEPFEYAYPKGNVIVQAIQLDQKCEVLGRVPNLRDRFLVSAKWHCLWGILGISMMFASLMIMLTAPWMMIPLIIFVGLGIMLHLKTQRMGIEVSE